MNFSLRICKIEKEGALLKFPLSKDYCALIFSTIDIRCNRFAGPETKSQGLFHQIHKEVTFCGLPHGADA